ncbi:MAG: glycosyltransferase family 29 protein [Pseudomonadota bacterium]
MKFAIVGNGQISDAHRREINLCDHVTRFNRPPDAHTHEGMRTTELVLANSSKQVIALARDGDFLSGPVFSTCERITLAFERTTVERFMPKRSLLSRIRNRAGDTASQWQELAQKRRKQFHILDADLYYEACTRLDIAPAEMRHAFPSTGFLSVLEKLQNSSNDDEITLYGFEHSGWKRHKWSAEEQVFAKLFKEGLLRIRSPIAAA